MGLDVHVGILAELHELGEDDGVDHYRDQFQKINSFLAEKKFPTHKEPEILGDTKPWTASLWGYNGLHELRRVAVHLLEGKGPPPPSTDRATKDELLDLYYKEKRFKAPTPPEMMDRSHPTPWGFKHLLLHSDCEGYYLPIHFKFVLFPPSSLEIAGGMIGSTSVLAFELAALGKALQVPSAKYDSDEVTDAAETGGIPDDPLPWKRLPIATHSCLVLMEGVMRSWKSKAAIVFS
jgi:hypothetical protein